MTLCYKTKWSKSCNFNDFFPQAAFDAAVAGDHASLAPEPVAQFYLADNEDVAKAKEEFNKIFMDVKEGKVCEIDQF